MLREVEVYFIIIFLVYSIVFIFMIFLEFFVFSN